MTFANLPYVRTGQNPCMVKVTLARILVWTLVWTLVWILVWPLVWILVWILVARLWMNHDRRLNAAEGQTQNFRPKQTESRPMTKSKQDSVRDGCRSCD